MKERILSWASNFPYFSCLNAAAFPVSERKPASWDYDLLVGIKFGDGDIGVHSFENLKTYLFNNKNHGWLFGYFSYDLKNEVEELHSENLDFLHEPAICFFEADLVIALKNENFELLYSINPHETTTSVQDDILNYWQDSEISDSKELLLKARISEAEYLNDVLQLKRHIYDGNIYEVNYCQEFFAEGHLKNPLHTYLNLSQRSPAPFASFSKFAQLYIMSQSPERFLKKEKNKLISQPIKGTLRRSADEEEDIKLGEALLKSEKDISENIMIVDLVRNDLSKVALPASVSVDELCALYSFRDVHHLISTVSCDVGIDTDIVSIIKSAFPMGSMTGAPKISAMKLIEEFEHSRRGVYSGALGYISPQKDFDFSVVIRTLIYNAALGRLSTFAGGAITAGSEPLQEYRESLLKLKAIFEVLRASGKMETV